MAYIVMAYIVMAYIVMAYSYGLYSHGLCSYGLYSYGLYSFGLYSYGLYSHGLAIWPCWLGSLLRPHPTHAPVGPTWLGADLGSDLEPRVIRCSANL